MVFERTSCCPSPSFTNGSHDPTATIDAIIDHSGTCQRGVTILRCAKNLSNQFLLSKSRSLVRPYKVREATYKFAFAQLTAEYTKNPSKILATGIYEYPASRQAMTGAKLVPYNIDWFAIGVWPRIATLLFGSTRSWEKNVGRFWSNHSTLAEIVPIVAT